MVYFMPLALIFVFVAGSNGAKHRSAMLPGVPKHGKHAYAL
jgi:hypothetical protein